MLWLLGGAAAIVAGATTGAGRRERWATTAATNGYPTVTAALRSWLPGGGSERATIGPSQLVLINDPTSPKSYVFHEHVPPGGHIGINPDGSATIYNHNSQPAEQIAKPWAYDSLGRPQRTWYTVDRDGNLVQHIDPESNALYPILADPLSGGEDPTTGKSITATPLPNGQEAVQGGGHGTQVVGTPNPGRTPFQPNPDTMGPDAQTTVDQGNGTVNTTITDGAGNATTTEGNPAGAPNWGVGTTVHPSGGDNDIADASKEHGDITSAHNTNPRARSDNASAGRYGGPPTDEDMSLAQQETQGPIHGHLSPAGLTATRPGRNGQTIYTYPDGSTAILDPAGNGTLHDPTGNYLTDIHNGTLPDGRPAITNGLVWQHGSTTTAITKDGDVIDSTDGEFTWEPDKSDKGIGAVAAGTSYATEGLRTALVNSTHGDPAYAAMLKWVDDVEVGHLPGISRVGGAVAILAAVPAFISDINHGNSIARAAAREGTGVGAGIVGGSLASRSPNFIRSLLGSAAAEEGGEGGAVIGTAVEPGGGTALGFALGAVGGVISSYIGSKSIEWLTK